MDKLETLIHNLNQLQRVSEHDAETAHVEADTLLLEYIGDPAVREAFRAIKKWYA